RGQGARADPSRAERAQEPRPRLRSARAAQALGPRRLRGSREALRGRDLERVPGLGVRLRLGRRRDPAGRRRRRRGEAGRRSEVIPSMRPLLITILLLAASCAAPAPVRATHAWVRAAEAGANTGGYFRLINDRRSPLEVTGATAAFAERAELHETIREGARVT